MAQEDKISLTFYEAESQTMKEKLAQALGVLDSKAKSLHPQQRPMFGRVNHEKEIYINRKEMGSDLQWHAGGENKPKSDRDQVPHQVPNSPESHHTIDS